MGMGNLQTILDRLAGVQAVREKLEYTLHRLDKLIDTVIDHEKRLVRLETLSEIKRKEVSY